MFKFLVLISANIMFLFSLILIPAQQKVDVRFALFTKFTDKGQFFKAKMEEIDNYGVHFRKFKQKYIDDILSQNEITPFAFDSTFTTEKKVEKIALSYSKNGGAGCGIFSDNLIKNIKWLHEDKGHGCCSDHAQAFIAICLVNKINAREVHHNSHTFNEYYDEIAQKWIWVDTQFCLLAKDEDGKLLSLYEIFANFNAGKTITWDFFGNENHVFSQKNVDPAILKYFSAEEFKLLAMTLGNNVFEVNYYNSRLKFLPKEISQLFLLSSGIQPSFLIYDPYDKKHSYYNKLKYLSYAVFFIFVAMNFLFIYRMMKK